MQILNKKRFLERNFQGSWWEPESSLGIKNCSQYKSTPVLAQPLSYNFARIIKESEEVSFKSDNMKILLKIFKSV